MGVKMPTFREKVKEPFGMLLNKQFSQLESTAETLETHGPVKKKWEKPKKNIQYWVIPQFKRWGEALDRIRQPLYNKKTFKRERKRLRRAEYFTWFHWRMLMVRGRILLMGLAFIVKIPVVAVLLLLKNILAVPMAIFYIIKRILVAVLCFGIVFLFFYLLYKFVMFIQ
jgi:hypothetical protein